MCAEVQFIPPVLFACSYAAQIRLSLLCEIKRVIGVIDDPGAAFSIFLGALPIQIMKKQNLKEKNMVIIE